MSQAAPSNVASNRRFVVGYLVVGALLSAAVAASLWAGGDRSPARAIAGTYGTESECLGEDVELRQSGEFVNVDGPGSLSGKLRLDEDRMTGAVTCVDGSEAAVDLEVAGAEKEPELAGTVAGQQTRLRFLEEPPEPGAAAGRDVHRNPEETFGRLMLAIAAVILAARLAGAAVSRLGQPRVMGEVLAGILLGPTLLGAVAPDLKDYLFPPDIVPLLTAGASIGLAFYMFLVGLELDPRLLRGRIAQAAFISNVSVAFPLALGFLVAVPVYGLVAPDIDFLPFGLFMGVAMSITAFPVLARILVERRMLRSPVGALALSGAAIDDVTAWGLLALATAVSGTGSGLTAVRVIVLAAIFSAAMLLIVRRLLGRVSTAYDEAGHVPPVWIGTIFVGILLAAWISQVIGIAPIFGAFVMGLVMPRRADLTEDVSRRLEDFVVTVLLPLFFVVTGLRTDVGSLDRPVLWLIGLVLLAVAIIGKWVGATVAARYGGFGWRESNIIGSLMNTRGLTELIVLNIGLELGVISPALFTMLVLVALVTTFMAGPALRVLDPHNRLSAAPEDELKRLSSDQLVTVRPERAILVTPLDERKLETLLGLAEPLASSEPRREIVLASLVEPARFLTGLGRDSRELQQANVELEDRRQRLAEKGIAARAVAFTSADPGRDVVSLAEDEHVDLVLMDGRRPLLGGGVPTGPVGHVLEHAVCDVAAVVESEGRPPAISAERPVVVPFGGAEHDWAALELGAWLASSQSAPLRLLGSEGDVLDGRRDASRLLANASLVVQQFVGIAAEPVLVEQGAAGVVEAAKDAGVLVVGLSDRWREEGLGEVRSGIAKSAPAPTIFVRRGRRPGALAPRTDMTRFPWSVVAPGPPAER